MKKIIHYNIIKKIITDNRDSNPVCKNEKEQDELNRIRDIQVADIENIENEINYYISTGYQPYGDLIVLPDNSCKKNRGNLILIQVLIKVEEN